MEASSSKIFYGNPVQFEEEEDDQDRRALVDYLYSSEDEVDEEIARIGEARIYKTLLEQRRGAKRSPSTDSEDERNRYRKTVYRRTPVPWKPIYISSDSDSDDEIQEIYRGPPLVITLDDTPVITIEDTPERVENNQEDDPAPEMEDDGVPEEELSEGSQTEEEVDVE